jgi:hypothetical protein
MALDISMFNHFKQRTTQNCNGLEVDSTGLSVTRGIVILNNIMSLDIVTQ